MGEEAYSEELEEIRRRKALTLRKRLEEEQQRRELEAAKQVVLRQILTVEARQRLTNIKMVKPHLAEQIEVQLIQAAQAGRLNTPVTDEQLKQMLMSIQMQRRETRIRRV